jgi:GR25 family glycosyltransferase involved in LPS biosynthesis
MGHVYKEVDGQEYLHSEFLQDDGEAYFVRGMAKGPIGIVLSHLSVLQDAYDSGFETIWVMEDDVEAVSDPREISGLIRKLDSLTDWDILFTDTDTTDPKGVKVPCRALPTRPNVFVPKLDVFMEKFYPIGDEFSRTGMRYGAYSMIVRRTGMKKILDYYRRAGVFIPYDMDFWLCSDLKMVCVNRDIVCHRKGALTDNHQPNY